MSKKIVLACSICNVRNYSTTKSVDNNTRLEMKKFCKHCNKQTVHKETK